MIKVIREFEWIQKKICKHKMSIMFNEICINLGNGNVISFSESSDSAFPNDFQKDRNNKSPKVTLWWQWNYEKILQKSGIQMVNSNGKTNIFCPISLHIYIYKLLMITTSWYRIRKEIDTEYEKKLRICTLFIITYALQKSEEFNTTNKWHSAFSKPSQTFHEIQQKMKTLFFLWESYFTN